MSEKFLRLLEARNKENALWAEIMLKSDPEEKFHELFDQLAKATKESHLALTACRPE